MLPLIFLVIGVLAQQTFAEEPEAIVGGSPAARGEFPHQCSIRYMGSHVCGCSIIAPTKVLTAAHCVDGMAQPPYRFYEIVTGSINVSEGEIHNVARAVMHPDYSREYEDAWRNDVAVITLTAPITYNENQQPIALATTRPAVGTQCTLSGWGQTSASNKNLPRTLLKMNQAVVSQEKCQESHYLVILTGSHLCTLNRYGIGVCSGDSGGPLVANDEQVGITSWGLPCAQGEPDVYTDVSYHHDWIKSQ